VDEGHGLTRLNYYTQSILIFLPPNGRYSAQYLSSVV
jgi:hypothetical protein